MKMPLKVPRQTLCCLAFVAGGLLCAPAWAQQQPAPSAQLASQGNAGAGASQAQPGTNAGATLIVPSGTRMPLVLHNTISTKNARPGDPVYLETTFPIVQNGRVLIPAGSYVQGEIVEAKPVGKIKGQGEVRIRLTTLILPNGYATSFDAVPAGTSSTGPAGNEGQVKSDTDRSADVGTVVDTTAVGAGVGAIAARSATGALIGAGAGSAVGLAMVMMTRGTETELPRGTSVDIELDRPLYLDAARIDFTEPGHASELPGPPSTRAPARVRPF